MPTAALVAEAQESVALEPGFSRLPHPDAQGVVAGGHLVGRVVEHVGAPPPRLAIDLRDAQEARRHRLALGVHQRRLDLDAVGGVLGPPGLPGDEDQPLLVASAHLEGGAGQEGLARHVEGARHAIRPALIHVETQPARLVVHHHRRQQEAHPRIVGRNRDVDELRRPSRPLRPACTMSLIV